MDVTVAPPLPALLPGGEVAELSSPLLTFYDDATGERTELTAATLGEWASRTACLLHEGCGLGIGSRAAILLPPHWQTAAVLFGAWAAGVAVSFRLWATAGLPELGPGADQPADVTFVSRERLDSWLEDVPDARHRFVLGLEPAAAPLRDVPIGYRDYIAAVDHFTDSLQWYAPILPTDAATVCGTSYQEWGSLARAVATSLDLRPGDRLLVDAAVHEHPINWLLAPLATGASVVLCANLDPDAVASRIASERITRVL